MISCGSTTDASRNSSVSRSTSVTHTIHGKKERSRIQMAKCAKTSPKGAIFQSIQNAMFKRLRRSSMVDSWSASDLRLRRKRLSLTANEKKRVERAERRKLECSD